MSNAINRANQLKSAFEGDGGLRDMFDAIRKAYFVRAGEVTGLSLDEQAVILRNMALASRIVDIVESNVRTIIDTGKIQEANAQHVARLAELPERKRNWLSR